MNKTILNMTNQQSSTLVNDTAIRISSVYQCYRLMILYSRHTFIQGGPE